MLEAGRLDVMMQYQSLDDAAQLLVQCKDLLMDPWIVFVLRTHRKEAFVIEMSLTREYPNLARQIRRCLC